MRKNKNAKYVVAVQSYNPVTKQVSGFYDKVVELPQPIYVLKAKK